MKPNPKKKQILFAIGNSARGDDGLGWAFARRLEPEGFDGEILYRYQLQIEDADRISDADTVIFVDATMEEGEEKVIFQPCHPSREATYTTHRLEPGAVLQLCLDLYGKAPVAYELLIRGYQWGLAQPLSRAGKANLQQAWRLWESIPRMPSQPG